MAYSKTSAPGPLPPKGTDPPRDTPDAPETGRNAPHAHDLIDVRHGPGLGILVGLAFMTVLSLVAVVIAQVIA